MTMLKKNFFSAAEAYAAPVCESLDVRAEVMCQSFNKKTGTEFMSNDAGEDF